MEKQTAVTRVAAEIREHILKYEAGTKLSSERVLGLELKASRQTVRAALERLRCEGLVDSRPGVGWFLVEREKLARFETMVTEFTAIPKETWPAHVTDLLQLRARQFVNGLDTMLTAGAKPTADANRALGLIGYSVFAEPAHEVLYFEEEVFTALLGYDRNKAHLLAVQQVRRALAEVRSHLDLRFTTRTLGALLNALFNAIEKGDQPAARELGLRAITARDYLYLRLTREAAGLDPPGRVGLVWGDL